MSIDTPDWYKKSISKKIPIPIDDNSILGINYPYYQSYFDNDDPNNFYDYFFNDINFKRYMFDNFFFDFDFDFKSIPKIDIDLAIQDIKKKESDTLIRIEKSNSKSKEVLAKTIKTKVINKIKDLGKIMSCKFFTIEPDPTQIKLLFTLFAKCNAVYNACVDEYNNDPNSIKFLSWTKFRNIIFKKLYPDQIVNQNDTLGDEVRAFCDNLKNCTEQLKEGVINHFEMKHKNNKYGRSILICKKSITKKGIYFQLLGQMKGLEVIDIENDIQKDCRLCYDKLKKSFTLCVPYSKDPVNMDNIYREEVVAIDPGEKIFASFYGLKTFGHLGVNMRNKILKIEKNIRRWQRILAKKKNKDGNNDHSEIITLSIEKGKILNYSIKGALLN